MAGDPYITQADLESKFPATHVRRVFSDDGSNTPGVRLERSISVCSRRADAILARSNWSYAQIEEAMEEDDLLKDAVCSLVMAHGCQGKPEWSGENAPYANLEKSALQVLKDVAGANLRSRAEEVIGENKSRQAHTHIASPKMFAGTRNKAKPGGY